ncbi:MAG: DUF4258 domain-containing protein [Planctomycetota bacterium]|jgi:hypothetical protein
MSGPTWLDWELVLTSHLLERMEDRSFTEIDLRAMMGRTTGIRPSPSEGRWVLLARFERRRWEVVVEPDTFSRKLVVITAYPVGEYP